MGKLQSNALTLASKGVWRKSNNYKLPEILNLETSQVNILRSESSGFLRLHRIPSKILFSVVSVAAGIPPPCFNTDFTILQVFSYYTNSLRSKNR